MEKINQLKNLIKCMKKKITIIQKVEKKRKERKASGNLIDDATNFSKNLKMSKSFVVTLRKLDCEMKNFELV